MVNGRARVVWPDNLVKVPQSCVAGGVRMCLGYVSSCSQQGAMPSFRGFGKVREYSVSTGSLRLEAMHSMHADRHRNKLAFMWF